MAPRKHRATGKKPPGGPREGAGRPEGTPNALPLGAVQAIRAMRWQVPEDAPEDLAALADRCFQRVADVLEERVHESKAATVLGAAKLGREWVCGPAKQRVEVGGEAGGPLVVEVHKYTTEGVPCQTQTSSPEETPQQQPPPEETPPPPPVE